MLESGNQDIESANTFGEQQVSMTLRMRLENLCEAKTWARLHFGDGTALTGRLLRLGHDYLEIETYGEREHPEDGDYARHLVPIPLLKYVTVESASFAEAERQRLNSRAQMDVSHDSPPDGVI